MTDCVNRNKRFYGFSPLPYTIDKTLTPALMYVFDQPLTEAEKNTGVSAKR